MRDEALRALLQERWEAAVAKSGERAVRNPDDAIARTHRAVALYEARRWAEAAKAFEEVLRREGPASEVAPLALFSLGSCRLQLGDDRGALEASVLFLEVSNDRHPSYREGLHDVACALDRLGEQDLSAQLYRASERESSWSRERILRETFRALGWRRKPLPPSRPRATCRAPPAPCSRNSPHPPRD